MSLLYTFHVVYKLKRAYNSTKVGHTGTLDPMVTGVMVVCFGRATKLAQFLLEENKHYLVTIELGTATDTEDITGKTQDELIITPKMAKHMKEELPNILARFEGTYHQTPPMYSALKVNGKKLYHYARENVEVKREARPINISKMIYHPESFLYNEKTGKIYFDFDVFASTGLYARTLCVDIGKAIGAGIPATMAALRRKAAGQYHETEAIPLADLLVQKPDFITIDAVKLPLEQIEVSAEIAAKLRVGYKLPKYFVEKEMTAQFAVYEQETGKLVGIYEQSEKYPDKYKSVRVM